VLGEKDAVVHEEKDNVQRRVTGDQNLWSKLGFEASDGRQW
jgi:hypothetical protein